MRYTAIDVGQFWFLWGPWLDYQATVMNIPFTVKPGMKTVLVEFMDVAGNVTQVQDSGSTAGSTGCCVESWRAP